MTTTRNKLAVFGLMLGLPVLVLGCSRLAFDTSWSVAVSMSVLSCFACCDVWYFLRLGWLVLIVEQSSQEDSASTSNSGHAHLLEASELHGRVALTDIDRNGHCNNARYLRECNFGRHALWQRNGVWALLKVAGGNHVVGALTIRYRRELCLGQRYTLQTRVLCWDARAFYLEHRFLTQDKANAEQFVNAIVLVKNSILGPVGPERLVAELTEGGSASPPMPDDVKAWIQSNEASSMALKAKNLTDGNHARAQDILS